MSLVFSFMLQELRWWNRLGSSDGISSIKSFQMPMFKVRCGHSFSIKYCLECKDSWTAVPIVGDGIPIRNPPISTDPHCGNKGPYILTTEEALTGTPFHIGLLGIADSEVCLCGIWTTCPPPCPSPVSDYVVAHVWIRPTGKPSSYLAGPVVRKQPGKVSKNLIQIKIYQ